MKTWHVASFALDCGFDRTHRIAAGDWYLQIATGRVAIRRCTGCAARTFGELPPAVDESVGEPVPDDEPAEVVE